MNVPIFQVDAFADSPFTGNPAAVCLMESAKEDGWMQNVAKEMNLSETAFVQKAADGFHLRWFTPASEVDLCGHATLAAAHTLWETGRLPRSEAARFRTRSGLLTARYFDGEIELNFPSTPDTPATPPAGLSEYLGVSPVYVGKSRFDYLVAVSSEKEVREISPDFRGLVSLGVRGVMVTAQSESPEFDFISRFFAPGVGVDEDPVTGSAHCCLTPYWSKILGKQKMTAFQASPRGGVVQVRLDGDRVRLRGRAVTVIRGELVDV